MDIDSLKRFIKYELDKKDSTEAGSVQILSVSLADEVSLVHVETRDYGGYVEIDFIGNFLEELVSYHDINKPQRSISCLEDIEGTIYMKDEVCEDLVVEYQL